MSAGGKTGLPANGDGTAERHVDEFLTDRKKDSRGNLRAMLPAATPENAPRMDFGETQKGATGILAGPSRQKKSTGKRESDEIGDLQGPDEGFVGANFQHTGNT